MVDFRVGSTLEKLNEDDVGLGGGSWGDGSRTGVAEAAAGAVLNDMSILDCKGALVVLGLRMAGVVGYGCCCCCCIAAQVSFFSFFFKCTL